jgi:pyruvate,water dikinase
MIASLLTSAKRTGSHTGICGQAPSYYPEFARFLVENGIDSISVTPDAFLRVKQQIAAAEAEAERGT